MDDFPHDSIIDNLISPATTPLRHFRSLAGGCPTEGASSSNSSTPDSASPSSITLPLLSGLSEFLFFQGGGSSAEEAGKSNTSHHSEGDDERGPLRSLSSPLGFSDYTPPSREEFTESSAMEAVMSHAAYNRSAGPAHQIFPEGGGSSCYEGGGGTPSSEGAPGSEWEDAAAPRYQTPTPPSAVSSKRVTAPAPLSHPFFVKNEDLTESTSNSMSIAAQRDSSHREFYTPPSDTFSCTGTPAPASETANLHQYLMNGVCGEDTNSQRAMRDVSDKAVALEVKAAREEVCSTIEASYGRRGPREQADEDVPRRFKDDELEDHGATPLSTLLGTSVSLLKESRAEVLFNQNNQSSGLEARRSSVSGNERTLSSSHNKQHEPNAANPEKSSLSLQLHHSQLLQQLQRQQQHFLKIGGTGGQSSDQSLSYENSNHSSQHKQQVARHSSYDSNVGGPRMTHRVDDRGSAGACGSSSSPSSLESLNHQKAVAFLAGPRERIHVLGNPVEHCPRCAHEGSSSVLWRPHRHIGELKIRYICDRHFNDLESPHHFDIPLCPICNQVLYLYDYGDCLGVSNARRLHKYVLKCATRHVLPLLDLFCHTKKGGERCNANFKLQWSYGTMVKRCEAQKNRDHDLWWVRYKNEWKQRRTIIRYKKDFLSHLSDAQRSLLLGLGLEGEPPPDPKTVLGSTFDQLVSSTNGGSPSGPKTKKRILERPTGGGTGGLLPPPPSSHHLALEGVGSLLADPFGFHSVKRRFKPSDFAAALAADFDPRKDVLEVSEALRQMMNATAVSCGADDDFRGNCDGAGSPYYGHQPLPSDSSSDPSQRHCKYLGSDPLASSGLRLNDMLSGLDVSVDEGDADNKSGAASSSRPDEPPFGPVAADATAAAAALLGIPSNLIVTGTPTPPFDSNSAPRYPVAVSVVGEVLTAAATGDP